MSRELELLSPAGSPESLTAAVACGAGAVYLAAPSFNARQSAKNFSNEQLKKAIIYCHKRKVKVYLTLNTLVGDKEAAQFLNLLKTVNDYGVDAVIVQDLGMAYLIKKAVPEMKIHASTQMSVHNLDGVLAAHKMGFSRVVLARELDFENIKYICKNSPIEIEVFVHGALCVSHSGQCLMSAVIAGRSGNRGRCGQPCRLLYSAKGQKPQALLSLKDLALIEHLQKLKNAGVDSFKIEGRLKRPQYVAIVTWIYNKALKSQNPPDENDLRKLEIIFSRGGFTDGYFLNKKGRQMFGTRIENENTMEFIELFKKAEFLYKNSNQRQNVSVDFDFKAFLNKPAVLTATDCDKNHVIVEGALSVAAVNRPLETKTVKEQLEKTGNTQYFVKSIAIEIENGLSMPLSAINALRRQALDKLDQIRCKTPVRKFTMPELYPRQRNYIKHPGFCVSVDRLDQLSNNILDAGLDYIYIPLELVVHHKSEIEALILLGQNICIKLSRAYFDTQKSEILEMIKAAREIGINTALCTNIGQIDTLKFYGFKIRGDFSLNVFNSYSLKVLAKMGLEGATLSYELMLEQIRDMRKRIDTELVVYARQELMLLENCIIKDSYEGCNKCKTPQFITDRMGEKFLIRGEYGCRNTVLNSHRLYLLDKLYEYDRLGLTHLRLNFTDESKQECEDIFFNALNCSGERPRVFTRGIYYKGVK